MSRENGERTRTSVRPDVKASVQGEVITIERGAAGVVHAEQVELKMAGAGVVFAGKDVTIERGGARDIVAAGEVHLQQSGAGMLLAGGDTTINQGGAGTLISLGRTDIQQGGAAMIATGSASVGRGGVVVFALTPRLEVGEGGRVIAGPMAVLAGLGLAVFGAMLLRRR
jgi:hypothetical protein